MMMKKRIVSGISILSIILLGCTLLCGLWVGTHEGCDLAFHGKLSIVSVTIAIVSEILHLMKCKHDTVSEMKF